MREKFPPAIGRKKSFNHNPRQFNGQPQAGNYDYKEITTGLFAEDTWKTRRNLTLTYATNVNTTSQQLIQAEVAINRQVSLLIARDESGVFSMVVKATRRFR